MPYRQNLYRKPEHGRDGNARYAHTRGGMVSRRCPLPSISGSSGCSGRVFGSMRRKCQLYVNPVSLTFSYKRAGQVIHLIHYIHLIVPGQAPKRGSDMDARGYPSHDGREELNSTATSLSPGAAPCQAGRRYPSNLRWVSQETAISATPSPAFPGERSCPSNRPPALRPL